MIKLKTSQRQLDRQKEYYKENKEYILNRNKKYDKENISKLAVARKNSSLKRRYGITLDQYKSMSSLQGNKCFVCKLPEKREQKGIVRSLSVDHDHATGNVRRLLCYDCNTALGLLREDLTTIGSLYRYVLNFNTFETQPKGEITLSLSGNYNFDKGITENVTASYTMGCGYDCCRKRGQE